MARKIRDGAMYLYFNDLLMLLCREFFGVNKYLETRIFFVLFAACLVWYGAQTFITDKVNDKEKKEDKKP